jgi:predicted ribosome quality control (RQC) complex YloA/Tae2 family protein
MSDNKVRVNLFYDKSIAENANYYFELAKKFSKKAEGALKTVEMLKARKPKKKKEKKSIAVTKPASREWYDQYPHFYTSPTHLLCVAGRNADENEALYRKHLEDDDLFFHADIPGAATVILKNGRRKAQLNDKLEAACFSASYSKAWKMGQNSVNVYAVEKQQLYKTVQKSGAFDIEGTREWFKNTNLRLKVGIFNDAFVIVPYRWVGNIRPAYEIRPGGKLGKDGVSAKLAKGLGIDEGFIKSFLPSGSFYIERL